MSTLSSLLLGRHTEAMDMKVDLDTAAEMLRAMQFALAESEKARRLAEMEAVAFRDSASSLLQDLQAERAITREYNLTATSPERSSADPEARVSRIAYHHHKTDKFFLADFHTMTGVADPLAFELLFDVCIGFTSGVLPCSYKPGRLLMSPSTKHVEEHKNFMFFVLYYLRRGDNSFAHLGMLFGFDKDKATRWYVAWLCALCLARLFPQPDMDLIRRTSPENGSRCFFGRLAGIIDCTEMRL